MPGARLRVAAAQRDEGESQIDINKVERDQVERIRIAGFSFGEFHQLSALNRIGIEFGPAKNGERKGAVESRKL